MVCDTSSNRKRCRKEPLLLLRLFVIGPFELQMVCYKQSSARPGFFTRPCVSRKFRRHGLDDDDDGGEEDGTDESVVEGREDEKRFVRKSFPNRGTGWLWINQQWYANLSYTRSRLSLKLLPLLTTTSINMPAGHNRSEQTDTNQTQTQGPTKRPRVVAACTRCKTRRQKVPH